MKTIKYGLEITFPDEDIADVNLIQRVLSEAPELKDCLVNIYIDEPNNEEELTKIARPCPSCAGREIHPQIKRILFIVFLLLILLSLFLL